MKNCSRFFMFAIGVFASALGSVAIGQVPSAAVKGRIADPSNAVVVGAVINLRNDQTGTSRLVETSREGSYQMEGLDPGDYAIGIAAPGFATQTYRVALRAGDYVTLNFGLKLSPL